MGGCCTVGVEGFVLVEFGGTEGAYWGNGCQCWQQFILHGMHVRDLLVFQLQAHPIEKLVYIVPLLRVGNALANSLLDLSIDSFHVVEWRNRPHAVLSVSKKGIGSVASLR